jgi:hypothetical protein
LAELTNISKFQEAQFYSENPSKTNPFVTVSAMSTDTSGLQAQIDALKDVYFNVTTTDATLTTIETIELTDNGVYIIKTFVLAKEDATGDSFGAEMFAVFKRIAGVTTRISTATLDRKSNFPAVVTIEANASVGNILIQVKGQAGKTIKWSSVTDLKFKKDVVI